MPPRSFKDLLAADESLFRKAEVFDPDYVPEDYIHRGEQMQSIARCIKPALRGERPLNAQIYGPPATGKTTAIRKLFQDLEDIPQARRIARVHINCQIHATKFGIFSLIHKAVVGHLPPETGVPFSKVYEAIFRKLRRENKILLVVLDDMNHLFYERYANEILYDILRAHEVFPGAKTGIFSIVSHTEFAYKLDDRVRSMFRPQEIYFPPYSAGEMYDILRRRAELGFFPGVISSELVEKIATRAYEHGDLRLGIELLRTSAVIAESHASRKITQEHIEEAYATSRLATLRSLVEPLAKKEKLLLKLLCESEHITSGELYERFASVSGLSYTKFYRILTKLEDIGLIEARFAGGERRGRSREISLRHPHEELEKVL
ncbi:ORC1-type DNA replication protein [Candidatus Pyrohabitans sp.]